MQDLNKLHKIMASGDVKRYHTVATLGEQTNATHCWGVAVIARYLYPEINKDLLLNTLLHDVGEIDTGDIPATVKWANPELKQKLDAIEDKLMKELDISYKMTTKERKILKQADMFELLFFCLKQRKLGNRHVSRIFGNGVEKLSDGNLNGRGEKLLANLVTLYGGI
jgi:5'-deoxynucleotidase YfbR-like HD superfamily hydrolase|tara:strand:+ start:2969 stop:3469 length:501 start_codon:yes stop_codon:yes gene_type:complete